MRSESTSALGQPRLTMPTRGSRPFGTRLVGCRLAAVLRTGAWLALFVIALSDLGIVRSGITGGAPVSALGAGPGDGRPGRRGEGGTRKSAPKQGLGRFSAR